MDLDIEGAATPEEAHFCDSVHARAIADAGVTGETMGVANEERGVSAGDDGERLLLPCCGTSAEAEPDLVLLLRLWLSSSILCLSSP